MITVWGVLKEGSDKRIGEFRRALIECSVKREILLRYLNGDVDVEIEEKTEGLDDYFEVISTGAKQDDVIRRDDIIEKEVMGIIEKTVREVDNLIAAKMKK